jgi:polysaccharide biosynthesis transport protein
MTAATDAGDARITDIVEYQALSSPARVLHVIRRRWRLISSIAIAGCLITYALCKVVTPLYVSRVTVIIDPRAPQRTAISTDPLSFLPPSEEAVRKNEIAIIRSRGLADATISRLKLDELPEFNPELRPASILRDLVARSREIMRDVLPYFGWTLSKPREAGRERDTAIDIFLSRLVTTGTDASRVIEIRFYAQDSQRAADIVNATAEQFIRDRDDQDLQRAQLASASLEAEISTLNTKIYEIERVIGQMRTQHGALPAANVQLITEQLSHLIQQETTADAQRAAAEGRLAELNATIAAGREDALGAVLDSLLIQHLQQQAAELAARISGMVALSGRNLPKVVEASAALTDLRSRISAEVEKIATSYRNALASAQTKQRILREMITAAKDELAKANVSEVDVRKFERQAEASRALMVQLVSRLNDTRSQMNRSGPGARIISPATVPLYPAFPPILPIEATALIFFITAGTIVATLLERGDHSIRSTTQIRQMAAVRVLGITPATRHISEDFQLKGLAWSRQNSLLVENLRGIWLQIDNARTLVITSAVPGEGKSTTAVILARLLALDGRRVVIVDADLRYPAVHKIFGLKQSPGLAEMIEASTFVRDAVQVDARSGASVIAAGVAIGSPVQVLGSPRIAEILAGLSMDFDTVIIDTPPLMAVPDAALVARLADATVMVVRWGSTKVTTFAAALQRLRDLNVTVKGVIMTMVDRKRYRQDDYPDSDMFSRAIRKYYSG